MSPDGSTDAPLSDTARAVDRELTEIAAGMDVLLEVSPVDTEARWREWRGGRATPPFTYRPLQMDPEAVQARLAAVPVDDVAEGDLRRLFVRARDALHLQAELARVRNTAEFLPASITAHGTCDDPLLDLATSLLDRLEPEPPGVERAGPQEFAARARREIERYRSDAGAFGGSVEVRDDVSGLMVVGRVLLVGTDAHPPRHRVEGLVHHEVGTHLLTAETGGRQPLHLLEHGAAGYEETQEALGVLAEYLVGELDDERLRVLAGRALAVRRLVEGACFGDVVDELVDSGSSRVTAWGIAARVFRAGGYTKDVVYLRGLVQLVEHLRTHPVEPLLVGKFHLDDLPAVESLLARGVLEPPEVRPHWLGEPGAAARLRSLGEHPVSTWPGGRGSPLR